MYKTDKQQRIYCIATVCILQQTIMEKNFKQYTYICIYTHITESLCHTPEINTILYSVQLLSHVQLFAIPRTAVHQASLSNSRSLLKFMSIESVTPSNRLILCRPLLLPPSTFQASGSFPMSQFFTSGGQIIGLSASISVLPMIIQDWFPLRWTGWISLQSKRVSRASSNTTVQKNQFFGVQLSL